MQAPNIENIVVDEANQRTYIVLAPRMLSDGEIYKAIRQEILKRGGMPPARGQTLTLTLSLTPSGGSFGTPRARLARHSFAANPHEPQIIYRQPPPASPKPTWGSCFRGQEPSPKSN